MHSNMSTISKINIIFWRVCAVWKVWAEFDIVKCLLMLTKIIDNNYLSFFRQIVLVLGTPNFWIVFRVSLKVCSTASCYPSTLIMNPFFLNWWPWYMTSVPSTPFIQKSFCNNAKSMNKMCQVQMVTALVAARSMARSQIRCPVAQLATQWQPL